MFCTKCNEDLMDVVGFDDLWKDYIECPNCGNKMIVHYEESWDGETESYWFYPEQYEENSSEHKTET